MTWEFSPELHTWWRLSCPVGHGSCSVGEKATLLRWWKLHRGWLDAALPPPPLLLQTSTPAESVRLLNSSGPSQR